MTARGGYRLLKIARTIADIDGDDEVKTSHLQEAAYFRNSDEGGAI